MNIATSVLIVPKLKTVGEAAATVPLVPTIVSAEISIFESALKGFTRGSYGVMELPYAKKISPRLCKKSVNISTHLDF